MENKLPILYKKTNNKIYFWEILSCKQNDDIFVITNHGIHKGKVKTSKRKIIKKGREDTLFKKSIQISKKKWNDKIKKEGYIENFTKIETIKPLITPMLAKKLNIKKIKFPVYVQPKLDGFRCISRYDNNIELLSRNNISYKGFRTLKEELKKIYSNFQNKNNLYLDGELYISNIPFEQLSGLIKRGQNHPEYDVKNIEFRVFDCFSLDDMHKPFSERINFLKEHIQENKNVKYVKTNIVKSTDELKEYFSKYIIEGYEGLMVRNISSPYEISKRSSYLQKYKEFEDDEFEIVGFQEGNGIDEKTIIWKCKTKNDKIFNVKPKGSWEFRNKLFENADKYIGKFLTVKYQEISDNGIPRFPVGKDIRDI